MAIPGYVMRFGRKSLELVSKWRLYATETKSLPTRFSLGSRPTA